MSKKIIACQRAVANKKYLYLVYVVNVYYLCNSKYIYRVTNKDQANCYQANKEKLLDATYKTYAESKKYFRIFIY